VCGWVEKTEMNSVRGEQESERTVSRKRIDGPEALCMSSVKRRKCLIYNFLFLCARFYLTNLHTGTNMSMSQNESVSIVNYVKRFEMISKFKGGVW